MQIEKYSVTQLSVNNLLSLIDSKDIAIPEIQRPLQLFGSGWKPLQHCSTIESPTSRCSKPKLAKELQFCRHTKSFVEKI